MKAEIRIVCPSLSLKKEDKNKIDEIIQKFQKEGYQLTFGKYIWEQEEFYECASIEQRVKDLMDAFIDPNVKAIICGMGGFNVNQILPYLDYDVIKQNPKIICGMSDITALLTAIYMKTNTVTYLGPNLLGFIEEYNRTAFIQLMECGSIEVKMPRFVKEGELKKEIAFESLQNGSAKGIIVGGNLCTLNLLQGTEYLKKKENVILFIEDDDNYKEGAFFKEFDRNLESLLQTNLFEIKAVLFGVFESDCKTTKEKLLKLISKKPQLKDIPIAMNINFGHTQPIFTLPIGGICNVSITEDVKIEISTKDN